MPDLWLHVSQSDRGGAAASTQIQRKKGIGMNDRKRIDAFERDWERRRQQDLERERMWGNVLVVAAGFLFIAAFGMVMGWW